MERIPRDHAPLTDQELAVLERVYDEFARTGEPVDGKKIVFDLKDTAGFVRPILQGNTLRPYLTVNENDGWVPRLRAAVRLWREDDLRLVDEYIRFLHALYRPEQPQLTDSDLAAYLQKSDLELKRLYHLTQDESFGRLSRDSKSMRLSVYIPERVLEWPTLADYLARDAILSSAPQPSDVPRAAVQLKEIKIKNFRVLADAASPELDALRSSPGATRRVSPPSFRHFDLPLSPPKLAPMQP